ncbi:MAG TPA: hypothetical protein VMQ51_10915 [Candidatus Binatia bacterium]|nr:hypothetical protein [Candidatus Binatia bacterium]
MLRQRRGVVVGLLALALLCVLWIAPAGAHTRDLGGAPARPAEARHVDTAPLSPSEESLTNPPPVAGTPAASPLASVAPLLGILLLGLGAARRPATAVRVLLALLLVVAAAETGIHSVHHLDSPEGSASCRVLTVTQQLQGEIVPELPSGAPLVEFWSYTVVAVPHGTAQSVRRPDEGRAPPIPLA